MVFQRRLTNKSPNTKKTKPVRISGNGFFDTMRVNIGSRIKLTRKLLGLTQEKFGISCGLNTSAISCFEKNIRTPSVPSLCRIITASGVSADFLLGYVDHMRILRSAEQILATHLSPILAQLLNIGFSHFVLSEDYFLEHIKEVGGEPFMPGEFRHETPTRILSVSLEEHMSRLGLKSISVDSQQIILCTCS